LGFHLRKQGWSIWALSELGFKIEQWACQLLESHSQLQWDRV
jgi:hypothetical protein